MYAGINQVVNYSMIPQIIKYRDNDMIRVEQNCTAPFFIPGEYGISFRIGNGGLQTISGYFQNGRKILFEFKTPVATNLTIHDQWIKLPYEYPSESITCSIITGTRRESDFSFQMVSFRQPDLSISPSTASIHAGPMGEWTSKHRITGTGIAGTRIILRGLGAKPGEVLASADGNKYHDIWSPAHLIIGDRPVFSFSGWLTFKGTVRNTGNSIYSILLELNYT